MLTKEARARRACTISPSVRPPNLQGAEADAEDARQRCKDILEAVLTSLFLGCQCQH
jgi:hypothetical protein